MSINKELKILLYIISGLLFACASREKAAPIENATVIPNYLKQDVMISANTSENVAKVNPIINKKNISEEPELGSLDSGNKPEQIKTAAVQSKKVGHSSDKAIAKFPDMQNSEWILPTQIKSIQKYIAANKGINITGIEGQAVYSTNNGNVVYSGSGLKGYGNLIIIKHGNTYLSAYAHNKTNLVKAGETVTRGQKIAEMGLGDSNKPVLHFEIRQNGKPIDPLIMMNNFKE